MCIETIISSSGGNSTDIGLLYHKTEANSKNDQQNIYYTQIHMFLHKLKLLTLVKVVGSRWWTVTNAHNCIFHPQHADKNEKKLHCQPQNKILYYTNSNLCMEQFWKKELALYMLKDHNS